IDVYSLESTNIDSLKKYAKHNCIQFSLGHIALLAAFGIMQYDNIPVIMLNVYCILVQRYNFIRIQECLERYDRLIELRINRIVSEVTECEESSEVTKQTSKLDQLEKQKETLLDAKEILLREKESIEATCTQTEEKQQSI
ncbi:MAG TPA: hypothetical protein DCY94_04705, partial [Firmicutes bacterium]|nr:hypothetical protein [Bacillota bacterium]